MTWSQALEELKQDKKVARQEWVQRANHQFLFLMRGEAFRKIIDKRIGPNTRKITDQIWITTSKRTLGPYTGCNCDIMANDWVVI